MRRESGPVSALVMVLARAMSVKTACSVVPQPLGPASTSGTMRLPPRRLSVPLTCLGGSRWNAFVPRFTAEDTEDSRRRRKELAPRADVTDVFADHHRGR
jgi:hypothetical protein